MDGTLVKMLQAERKHVVAVVALKLPPPRPTEAQKVGSQSSARRLVTDAKVYLQRQPLSR